MLKKISANWITGSYSMNCLVTTIDILSSFTALIFLHFYYNTIYKFSMKLQLNSRVSLLSTGDKTKALIPRYPASVVGFYPIL